MARSLVAEDGLALKLVSMKTEKSSVVEDGLVAKSANMKTVRYSAVEDGHVLKLASMRAIAEVQRLPYYCYLEMEDKHYEIVYKYRECYCPERIC